MAVSQLAFIKRGDAGHSLRVSAIVASILGRSCRSAMVGTLPSRTRFTSVYNSSCQAGSESRWMMVQLVVLGSSFSVFQELSYLMLDLSQAGKKKLLLQAEATDRMTTIFNQNDNFNHFVHLLSFLPTFIFFSACDNSHVKWDNSRNSTQKMRT